MIMPNICGKRSGFITLCIIVIVLLAASGTATAQSLSLQGPERGLAGETVLVDLMLDQAPGGLSGYDISLHLVDVDAGNFHHVDFPDWAGLHSTSSLPSPTVRIKAADTGQGVAMNDASIVLGTLSILCEKDGPLVIEFDKVRIDTETGNQSLVSSEPVTHPQDGTVVATTVETGVPAVVGPSGSGGSGRSGSSGGPLPNITLYVTAGSFQTHVPPLEPTQGIHTTTAQGSPVPTPATTRAPLQGGIMAMLGIAVAAGVIPGRR